jgi:hypothetical protein
MFTVLTQEELDVLNELLDKIPLKEPFNLSSIHALYIINPQYPRATDGSGLTKQDAVKRDYANREVYLRITSWLIEQRFAVKINPAKSNLDLELTGNGELLCAYGACEKYFRSISKSTTEEVMSRIPAMVELAPPYGEFTAIAKIPTPRFMHIDMLNPNDAAELEKILNALNPKEQLIELHQQSVKDDDVLQYLVSEGYAINRHDIKVEGKHYRQLTDKGRHLKELGTIHAYNNYLENEKKKQRDNEENLKRLDRRNRNLFWINFWIAVGACFATIYYFLEILRVQYHLGLPNHVAFLH